MKTHYRTRQKSLHRSSAFKGLVLTAAATFAACTYTISGTVASYNYPVVIYNNGTPATTVNSNGLPTNPFSFSTSNALYSLTATAPGGETCPPMSNWSGEVEEGFGFSINTAVTVQISCYPMFISGTVSGYNPGGPPIYITNNDGPPFTISSNGVFELATSSSSNVIQLPATLPGNPPSQNSNCQIANAVAVMTGTAATVANVEIYCQTGIPVPPSNWTSLQNQPPASNNPPYASYVALMLLMTDGTVIANQTGTVNWFRLTPDSSGHYVNGTWSTIANSLCAHGQFASQVLQDGRVFVAGGELPGGINPASTPTCPVVPPQAATSTTPAVLGQNGTGVETEIYDPVANTWTFATPPTTLIDPNAGPQNYTKPLWYDEECPAQSFQDMTSELLDDGRVLMAPVCPKNCGDTLIFDPTKFSPSTAGSGWSLAGTLAHTGTDEFSCSEQETSWVKLQDHSVLTADPPMMPGALQTSERYIPQATPPWVADQNLGFTLFNTVYGLDSDGEEGPAFLLPNGQAIFIGGSSVYGIYTPGGGAATGSWQQFPLPTNALTVGTTLAADDKPGVMMANGKILLALNFAGTNDDPFPTPVFFFEYEPTPMGPGVFNEVAGPPGVDLNPWADCSPAPGPYFNPMLALPDGTVLMSGGCNQSQLYVYTPSGPPLQQGQPTIGVGPVGALIGQVSPTSNTFLLAGAGLTGISEGASFGDDAQMASNYPLVQLTDSTGHVFYARTHDWLSLAVAPSAPGNTLFDVPLTTPPNVYSLRVIVNGNPSAPVKFTWSCPSGYVWIPLPIGGVCTS
jgi:hypothetical protein